MKARTTFYALYLIFSILLSLSVATIPALLLFLFIFERIDALFDGFGFPFTSIKASLTQLLAPILPQFFVEHFWFIVFLIPLVFLCYCLFLGILLGMFLLSRRLIPYLEDGYYPMETEEWLLYEFYEVYYILFPFFAWFFTVFMDTKPRHMAFGAKIGKNTIIGNGRLFNPERTIIGDNCFFGYDAILSGHVYESGRLYLKTVRLGNNVTVGANAVILPGADIGDNVIIAANSTVPKDKVIPANSIWVQGKVIPRKVRRIDYTELGIMRTPSNNDLTVTETETEENKQSKNE